MRRKNLSIKDTAALAATLAARVRPGRGARVFGLVGELGSGKTTFTKAFARTLGVRRMTSPTFILMRRSLIRKGPHRNLFHIDAYRLRTPQELLHLGWAEIVRDPENLVFVEWADRIKKIMPKDAAWIRFEHGRTAGERIIRY